MLVGVALALLLAGGAVGSGQIALLLCALGSAAFGVAMLLWCHELEPNYTAFKFLMLAYLTQPVFVAALAMLGYFQSAGFYSLPVSPQDEPLIAALGLMVVPAGAGAATAVFHLIPVGARDQRARWQDWLMDPPPNLAWFLVIGALVSVCIWVMNFATSSFIGYFFRVLHKAMFFVPLMAGAYFFHFKRTRLVWLLVLVANLALGFLTGSRTWGFYPLFLYGLGLYLATPRHWKWRLTVLAIPAGAALMLFLGLTGVVRDQLGRGGSEVVTAQRVNDALIEASASMSGVTLVQSMEAPLFKAMTRIVRWTNVVVPMMTPGVVPYRGLSGVRGEFMGIFSLGQFSSERFYANEVANEYGFRVDEGTSVEFGILPDGWSRGGPIVAFFYAMFATGFLLVVERILRSAFRSGSALMMLLLTFLLYIGFVGFISFSLFSQIRLCLLCLVFLTVIFWPLERLTLAMSPRRR